MKTLRKLLALCVLTPMLLASSLAAQVEDGTYTYGIEIKDSLCGYAEAVVATVKEGDEEYQLLKQKIFVMLSALGSEFNTEIDLTYHVDPDTGQFTYQDSHVSQGEIELDSTVVIEGNQARLSSSMTGEKTLELPAGVLLENGVYMPYLKRAFVGTATEQVTYDTLEVQQFEIQQVTCTRAGTETLELAGKVYDTLILDSVNLTTGVKIRTWMDVATGLFVKVIPPNDRLAYLADPSIKKKIELTNIDSTIATRTNVSIPDLTAITYLKVKAVIEPTGQWFTPADLNVPGQRFEGTVTENLIEGVFEIEHPRYDGADAPPYPVVFGDYGDDEALREYVEPSDFIESGDPVLIDKARELAEGSKDSWEAARRLSQWVAEKISYEIPGGGTARKVYDMRAGECGGHSTLLATFCRAVDIPARVVWGCMYTPDFGGAFGQHAWTEVYMGKAGWVPVDSTAYEIDFVDSGHLRIGEHRSFATALNAKSFEILEYRMGTDAEPAEGEATLDYTPYVGKYDAPGGSDPFEVLVQDGGLALDIPGKMTLPFNDPDEKGIWRCKLSPNLHLVFPQEDDGGVSKFILHELVRLRRKSDPEEISDDVPAELRPHLGVYYLQQLKAEFEVLWDGRLAFRHPLRNVVIHLGEADAEGWRDGELGAYRISFEPGDEGKSVMMVIDAMNSFPKSPK